MSKITNLNKFRKKKARADKTRRAAENRVRHGRTLAERTADALENQRNARVVDGARRQRSSAEAPSEDAADQPTETQESVTDDERLPD